ncbi:hypothetical protein CBR_g32474 [Chara braunii]|uniref:DOMON domain-containing protein n=1 Tax=Chara braunii TaxID=69332 RepID=A0A388LGP5_CHABU|nr:hypothetical protein CBR_g32474 [Chara braunii]|eukprot:GBG81484.1 hypothetical protein CBR_g32474 [Chara braunii]
MATWHLSNAQATEEATSAPVDTRSTSPARARATFPSDTTSAPSEGPAVLASSAADQTKRTLPSEPSVPALQSRTSPAASSTAAAELSMPAASQEAPPPVSASLSAAAPSSESPDWSMSVPSPSPGSLEGLPAICLMSDLPEFRCMMPLGPPYTFLYFSPPSDTWLHMGFHTISSGWVALGWSADGEMPGSEAAVAGLNKTATVAPYALTGRTLQSVLPASDNSFTLLTEGTAYRRGRVVDGPESSERALLLCNRSLSGGKVPLGSSFFAIWAYQAEGLNALSYHGHEARGSVVMNMSAINFENPGPLPEGASLIFTELSSRDASVAASVSPPSSSHSRGWRVTSPGPVRLTAALCVALLAASLMAMPSFTGIFLSV